MTQKAPTHDGSGITPLSRAEQYRLNTALDDVSTRTLLFSLLEIERDSEDARLIIRTLLDRVQPSNELPAGGPDRAAGS